MRLSKETATFIEKHIETTPESPFFAYLSFYAVHSPIQTTEQKWLYYREKAEKLVVAESGFIVDCTLPVRQHQDNPIYAGLVSQMDDAVGLLLTELERLGVDENTIIIFTSDNGGVSSGDAYSTSCLPLRGEKGRQWEGGLRVPLIVKYPKCKTTVVDEPVIATDLYPTILDLVDIEQLESQHIDGMSLCPLMSKGKTTNRTLFWHYPHYGNQGGETLAMPQIKTFAVY